MTDWKGRRMTVKEFQVQVSNTGTQVPQTERMLKVQMLLFITGFCRYKAITVWKCPQWKATERPMQLSLL